jgi:hypothetical protein
MNEFNTQTDWHTMLMCIFMQTVVKADYGNVAEWSDVMMSVIWMLVVWLSAVASSYIVYESNKSIQIIKKKSYCGFFVAVI